MATEKVPISFLVMTTPQTNKQTTTFLHTSIRSIDRPNCSIPNNQFFHDNCTNNAPHTQNVISPSIDNPSHSLTM